MPLFEKRRFYKENFFSYGYNIYCAYKVNEVALFEETPVFIAHPVVKVTTKLNILGPDIKLLYSWLQHR